MKFKLYWISGIIIILFSVFPLFFNLPFRIHLDLPWEGTYRLYLGQVPFRDFGMPFGYGFFILPLLSFYVFGPYIQSLLFGQVIVNLIAGFTFQALLKEIKVSEERSLIAVFVFSLSYTFLYFWPWYNHTALAYELIGLLFLIKSFHVERMKSILGYLALSSLFIFLTFFTKQDYGGLAFLFGLVLVLYHSWVASRWIYLSVYILFYGLFAALFIVPLLQYDFGYWFNYGQPPHVSRLDLFSILNEIMLNSQWEKFYLGVIVSITAWQFFTKKFDFRNSTQVIQLLIAIGFVLQALITKQTSGNSNLNTTYYHGFAIAFILIQLPASFFVRSFLFLIINLGVIFLWWSGEYWKYSSRLWGSVKSDKTAGHSGLANDTTQIAPDPSFQQSWKLSALKGFKGVKLPQGTIDGINRLKNLTSDRKDLKVLNMTELTMLPLELNYVPLKGLPLWYHKDVIVFPKQINEICTSITEKQFDLVMFEIVPSLNNFFPDELRACLQTNYKLIDTFVAPRKEGDSSIEVYLRPD
jgi:hypothetical protein